jgi:hypothetical protein
LKVDDCSNNEAKKTLEQLIVKFGTNGGCHENPAYCDVYGVCNADWVIFDLFCTGAQLKR